MWLKFLLGICFALMLAGALLIEPARPRSVLGARDRNGATLRLMTWNIGYGDLEADTRAHTQDLPAVAQVILSNDPDAVALQELTGQDQLDLLLRQLKHRYRGSVSSRGSADRVAAVLVKDRSAQFNDVSAGDRFAAAATFHLQEKLPQIVFVSAHADAFNASRRRTFAADVVDWARSRGRDQIAFVAGDFNLEVSVRNRSNLFTDDAKNDSESYGYLLKYFRDLGREAGETSVNDRRIDYVFGPQEAVALRKAEVLRGTAIGRMDHWPLLIEIGL